MTNLSAAGSSAADVMKKKRVSEAARLQATMRASASASSGVGGKAGGGSSVGSRGGGVFGAIKGFASSAATAKAAKEADRELTKAHSREANRLKLELEEMTFRAELHEEMGATLSGVLKNMYARNLQLEDLLRDAGVDPEAEAAQCELTPLKIDSIAGITVDQLDAGRDMPDGNLRGTLTRTASSGGGGGGERSHSHLGPGPGGQGPGSTPRESHSHLPPSPALR